MTAHFQVNPDELQQVGDHLNSLGPTMQKMKSVNPDLTGVVGGDDIVGAVSGFANTWNYGAGLLEKHVATVAKNVTKAGANYATADGKVISATQHVTTTTPGG